jgi:hypothetical protein
VVSNLDENELSKLLLADKQLKEDPEKRQLYLTYAGLFMSNFSSNLDATSLELDEQYQTRNPSSWQKFLKYPVVKRFIDGFIDERSERTANKVIGTSEMKTRDALKVKEQAEIKQKGEDNSNIVVMFLPQKEYIDL